MAEIEIQDEGFVASGLQIVARNYLEGILFIKWLYFIIIINYKSLLLFIKKFIRTTAGAIAAFLYSAKVSCSM